MPNWWETEPQNSSNQQSAWQRRVAGIRTRLGWRFPSAGAPGEPAPPPAQPAAPTQPVTPAQPFTQPFREPAFRFPTPEAAPPQRPFDIHLPTVTKETQRGAQGRTGYYLPEPPAPEPVTEPLPPGAPTSYLGVPDVSEEYERRGAELLGEVFGRSIIEEEEGYEPWAPSWAPPWLQRLNRFIELSASRGIGRIMRAWEHPEERARLGGPVEGLGLDIEDDEAPEGEKPPGFFKKTWKMFTESQEAAPGATYFTPEGVETYQAAREAETPEARQAARIKFAQLEAQVAPPVPWLGELWKNLAAAGKIPRAVEQSAAVGLQLLQEPTFGAIEVGAAIDILSRPESRDLTVEQWYPLTTRAWSLYTRQIKDAVAIDAANIEQVFAGTMTLSEWQKAHEPLQGSEHFMAKALLDIADGTATAEQIALANENFGMEMVGQIITDPLNWGLAMSPITKGLKAKHLAQAQARMLEPVLNNPKAMAALDLLNRAMEAGGLRELRAFEKAAARAGEIPSRSVLDQLLDIAKTPFRLTPEAQAIRDLGEITLAAGPLIAMADNGDDAIRLLKLWADNPAALRPLIGRIPDSLAGKKAGTVFRHIVDELATMPSAKAIPWDVKKFWADLDEVAHLALRGAYGYTKPGRIARFFGAYKSLMSEFYLTATYSPGYITRNAIGDSMAMALDGLMTFESRQVIDAYFDELGEFTTRRIMTEGAAGREALAGVGEVESMLPGPFGAWSKLGQKITRFSEPFGRLPLGEESRYRRALYKGLKRFFDQNALEFTPDLPELVLVRYGNRAEDLRQLVGLETNLEKRRQLVTNFLHGEKGAQMSPLRYVDDIDLDAVSPEIIRRLLDDMGKLTGKSTVDDIREVMARLNKAVDEEEARRLAEMANLPASAHLATDIDEAELADDLVDTLEDLVARTGDETLAREAEEIKRAIPTMEEQLDAAREMAIDSLTGQPTPDGLEVLMRANSDVEALRNEWRKMADVLRRDAKAAYDANPQAADEIWRECFRATRKGWDELSQARVTRYTEAGDQLARLRRGESVEDILGTTRRTRAEEWLRESLEVPGKVRPKGYMPGRVLRSNEDEKFQRFLAWQRSELDGARTNAWRAVYGSEPKDYGKVLDLLDSADRDVELWGKATAGRVRRFYRDAEAAAQNTFKYHKSEKMRQLAVDRIWEKYWAARNDAWRDYWRAGEQRWQIAERDILMDNFTRGQRMKPPVDIAEDVAEGVPVTPRPTLTPEDAEIVKRAALKHESQWTPAEREAIERWTGSGRAVPRAGKSVHQGGLPVYPKEQFMEDLAKAANLTDEQTGVMGEILDAMADTWSKRTGYTSEQWYSRHFAGLWRGNPPDQALFQGASQAPRWWYKTEQIVDAKMPNRADVQQVRNIIAKGGIKKDELQWNGVQRWLEGKEGMITKDEVMGYLQANRVQVEEILAGDLEALAPLTAEKRAAEAGYWQAVDSLDAAMSKAGITRPERRRMLSHLSDSDVRAQLKSQWPNELTGVHKAEDNLNSATYAWQAESKKGATKYGQYTAPGAVPGSYRELKFAMPWKAEEPLNFDEWLEAMRIPPEGATDKLRAAYRTDLADPHSIAYGRGLTFREPHWNDPNVVAHLRFNERVGPNGERVAYIEEMQSFWHQTGREKGYRRTAGWPDNWSVRPPTKEERFFWEVDPGGRVERLLTNNKQRTPTFYVIRHPRKGKTYDNFDLFWQDRNIASYGTIEEARKAAWDSVEMPNHLLGAFDEQGKILGYGFNEAAVKTHVLTSVPPKAPFAGTWDELCLKRMMHWAAENDYDAIAWTSGAVQVDRYPKATREVLDRLEWAKDPDGFITVRGSRSGARMMETKFGPTGRGSFLGKEVTLEEAFGKDLAQQIADSPATVPGIYEGRDFVVGDQALADLYDRIFPYSANKLTKRWGVGVEDFQLPMGTEPMRGLRVGRDGPGTFGIFNETDELIAGGLETYDEAAEMLAHTSKPFIAPSPGFRLTPRMKQDILDEGLPLFQRLPDGAKAATDFLEDGRAVIRFFEGADFSSAIHEVAHVVLKTLPTEDIRLVEAWTGLGEGEFLKLHGAWVESTNLARKAETTGQKIAFSPELIDETVRYERAQEMWARGLERYMAEGVAPTPELEGVFERAKSWLLDIYHRIKGSSIDVEITDEIRGVMDRLLAQNPIPRLPTAPGQMGQPIFQRSEPLGSRAFRRWFGDSTLLDEDGPKVLYHGTNNRFTEFKPGLGGMIWFTDKRPYTSYLGRDAEVMEVYVRMEYPLDLTSIKPARKTRYDVGLPTKEFNAQLQKILDPWDIKLGVDIPAAEAESVVPYMWVQGNAAELGALAKSKGFDGIIVQEHFFGPSQAAEGKRRAIEFANSHIVFDPKQVKSIKNPGGWDIGSADILAQAEPVASAAAGVPGIGANNLAQRALAALKESGGYTLGLDGAPRAGGYAVSIYPDAERVIPMGEVVAEDIVEYIGEHANILSRDPRAHLGGWVDEGQAYLDLSAVVDSADEAMLIGWENKQKAIFNLNTFEDMPVTRQAADEAARRLGRSLPRQRPTLLQRQNQRAQQLGFWNVDPANWRQYNEAIRQPGATAGPLPHDILQRSTEATRRALGKIEEGVIKDWDSWQRVAADQEVEKVLMDWLDNDVTPAWFEQRAVAYDYAQAGADFSVLDYSRRRNFDTWLNYVAPYHYWFTRAGKNWAKRLAARPQVLSGYTRTRDAMELANEKAGRRQRFQHMARVPFPWLPGWMGDSVYIDPMALLAPFSQIFYSDYNDAEENKQGLSKIYDTARGFGLRPYHFWEYLYQTGAFAKAGELVGMEPEQAQRMLGPEYNDNFPNILPQTNLIRGVSALAREAGAEAIPPGGINIEAPFRKLIGLPAGEIWDPYRLNRMLANLAAERPNDMNLSLATLRAQELVSRDEEQTGKVWSESSELAQQTAQEMGWTTEQLTEAQEILAMAMQRSTMERSVGTAGWLMGPRLAVEPAGERAQLEMTAKARTTTWDPSRPGGSREAYEQFKRNYPAMYPRATQYEAMPGEKEYEAMPPGARANWLVLRQQKEKLHSDYDQAVDDLLRREPWNWSGRGAIEEQRRAALAELEALYPMPEMEGEVPAILYGMNPTEMWNSTVEKELYRMQATKPQVDAFETEEGIDWDAYNKQVTRWRANLPRVFAFGMPRGGDYERMDPATAMRNFEQRYDSPLEAAYKTYQAEVATPAWNSYNKAKAEEERQWPGLKDLQDQYWDLDQAGRRSMLQQHPELKDYWDWKDQRGPSAYERTVGKVRAVPAAALVPLILEQYQTQGWTEEQLKRELEGVIFPPLSVQQDLKRGGGAQQTAAAAAPAGGGYAPGGQYAQRSQYSPAQLRYLVNKILRQWNARQGRYSGGGGGGRGGRAYRSGSQYAYGGGDQARWHPRTGKRGGPFTWGGGIQGGPFTT